ncbi:MAG: hypothetical protein M5R36_02675 [Deltaproteobacteria bacterium]|nr:hypothetical protein [Deltaproteobacteria bacterium]
MTMTMVNNVVEVGEGDLSIGVWAKGATMYLVNNVVDGGAGVDSFGIYGDFPENDLTLVHNNLFGAEQNCLVYLYAPPDNLCLDELTEVNSCSWAGCAAAFGNISGDPLFVSPGVGDYHIQFTSPNRNAGFDPIPAYVGFDLAGVDIDGDVRPYGDAWDIGIDEWTP